MGKTADTKLASGEGIWEHFTIRDGLPDMKIECVYEDSQGLIWIGTHEGGVVRYDGYAFKTYNHRDNGLAGNGVFSAIEDDDGNLFFGTNMGISRFDGLEFETFNSDDEPHSFLWGSCKDHEGRLWFGLEGEPGKGPAACRWDGKSLERVVLGELDEKYEKIGESINAVDTGPDGSIWLGGESIYVYRKNKKINVKIEIDDKLNISSIICGGTFTLVATRLCLYKFAYNKKGYKKTTEKSFQINSLFTGKNVDTCYSLSSLGELSSIKSNGNMKLISKNKGKFWRGMECKYKNTIWIGTYGLGLYRYDHSKFAVHNDGNHSDTFRFVEKENGYLRLSLNRELISYDTSLCSSKPIIIKPSDDMLLYIQSELCEDVELINEYKSVLQLCLSVVSSCSYNMDERRLVIGASTGYIFVVDEKDELIRYIATSRPRSSIGFVKEDSTGCIWYMSKYGMGYGYIDDNEEVFFEGRIRSIEIDKDDNAYLAIGAMNETEIRLLEKRTGKSRCLITLPETDVSHLFVDDVGRLWIGTNTGLYVYGNGKLKNYTAHDGLPCDLITTINQSRDGLFWIGTQGGGVCCYDGSVFQTILIPGEPGINIINDIHEDRLGRIWFATEAGLIEYKRYGVIPSVQIMKIAGDKVYSGVKRPSFPSTTSYIRFHIVGKSPADDSHQLVYRYRLLGHSKKWKQSRNPIIEFRELKPGSYTFEVQAVDRDLNYSPKVKKHIVITADPWIAAIAKEAATGTHMRAMASSMDSSLMIADCDAVLLEHCTSFLRKAGYKIDAYTTISGSETILDSHDVVLLDIDNFILIREELAGKSKRVSAKIILLTDYNYLEEADKAVRGGVFTYLAKPFETHQLLERVEQAIYRQKDELLVYIRNNLKDIHSRDELAEIFNISPNTVSNRVRRAARIGFSRFLQRCRIQEAQRLLVQTNLQVRQIAYNTGFESHEGLTRTFKKHTGHSPQGYRNEMRLSPE